MAANVLHTAGGLKFGLLGEKGPSPAPTLFVFGPDLKTALEMPDFALVGHLLTPHGFLLASLDSPCHGNDLREDEVEGLAGWRTRLERGEDPVTTFTGRASQVLDHLIQEGYTDPRIVAACGSSRGAFLALHFTAADTRIRCVAAFAPVTDLLALREFEGEEINHHQATRALNIIHKADQLADRAVWLCIGLDDERVSTDSAIALTRRIVEEAVIQGLQPNVELHVMPPVGHYMPLNAHESAAAWILRQIEEQAGEQRLASLP